MKSRGFGWMLKSLTLAAAMFVLLPASVLAQDGYWGRQDRREDRRERRQDRREDRRDRRQDRREDRQERREGRRGYGWGNYGGWGGSSQLRQTALNAGYNEGIKEGRNDRRRGDRFNYADEGDFRSADKDYSSRLGSRALYQRYFRQGFENGYRDGWNGY